MGRISMPQGRGSLKHNIRDYTQEERAIHKNIHFDKSDQNIVFVHKDIKDAYEEIFGDSVREYNAKQRRNDRKIKNDDYLSKIKTSKNGEHIFYEDILQWGDHHDFYKSETREKAAMTLKKYIETFEERNPNLKLIGAYIHMDEASPHLHFDYIPVATGYKTGLSIRNSLSKAMEQMGYVVEGGASKKNNQTMLWKGAERKYFATLCEEAGLEVDPEKSWGRKNLSVEEYKEAKMDMDENILEFAEMDLRDKKYVATLEVEKYKKEAKEKIDSDITANNQQCDQKIKDANEKAEKIIKDANDKADKIINEANCDVEGIRNKADRTKKQAYDELLKATETNKKSEETLKWIEGRRNSIQLYESEGNTFIDFFRSQLKNVRKAIAKISGLVLSSSSFSLEGTEITHAAYIVENTNPYPVLTKSYREEFSLSFEAHESLIVPADETIVKEYVDDFCNGDIEVSPVDLNPEIRKRNIHINLDIDP